MEARADPANGTPADAALASSGRVEPGGSREAGDLAIPADAEALYVWCALEGHEAAGERLTVPLAAPHADDEEAVPAPTLGLWGLAALALALARGGR